MATRSRASVSHSSKRNRGDKKENVKEEEETSVPAVQQLAWKIINRSVTDKLMGLSPRELSKELASILKFQNLEIDLKEASEVDFYVTAIWFARENDLTAEQCSAFFTIVHTLMNNIKDRHLSITDNIKEMRSMMAGIGISQLTALQCFTVKVANTIIQYIADNLLQHYSLYEFLYTEEQEDGNDILENVLVNLPPLLESLCPAPLEEAVTDEFYNQYISSPSSPPPTTRTVITPVTPVTTQQEEELEDVDSQQEQQQQQQQQQEDLLSEPQHSLLSKMSHEEIRSAMNKITQDTVSNYKAQIEKTLHTRETEYSTKLEKIAGTVK